jgi:hypothetical protein
MQGFMIYGRQRQSLQARFLNRNDSFCEMIDGQKVPPLTFDSEQDAKNYQFSNRGRLTKANPSINEVCYGSARPVDVPAAFDECAEALQVQQE